MFFKKAPSERSSPKSVHRDTPPRSSSISIETSRNSQDSSSRSAKSPAPSKSPVLSPDLQRRDQIIGEHSVPRSFSIPAIAQRLETSDIPPVPQLRHRGRGSVDSTASHATSGSSDALHIRKFAGIGRGVPPVAAQVPSTLAPASIPIQRAVTEPTPPVTKPPIPPQSEKRAKDREIKIPILPHAKVDKLNSQIMYWSRTPVFGKLPPKGMRAHTATVVGCQCFVFGGVDKVRKMAVLDLDTFCWSEPVVSGEPPPPVRAHTATAYNDRIYYFGGGQDEKYYNHLYVYDTLIHQWSQPETNGRKPTPRRAHTAVLYGDRIIIFGGGDGKRALNEFWELDLKNEEVPTWNRLNVKGEVPKVRGYHSMNLVGDSLVIFGGSDGDSCFGEIVIVDLTTMECTSHTISDVHKGRLSHSCTLLGNYLVLIGGHDGISKGYLDGCLLEMFNLDTFSFESKRVGGAGPSARGYHSAVLYDSRIILIGGWNGQTLFDECWTLDLASCGYLAHVSGFQLGGNAALS